MNPVWLDVSVPRSLSTDEDMGGTSGSDHTSAHQLWEDAQSRYRDIPAAGVEQWYQQDRDGAAVYYDMVHDASEGDKFELEIDSVYDSSDDSMYSSCIVCLASLGPILVLTLAGIYLHQ